MDESWAFLASGGSPSSRLHVSCCHVGSPGPLLPSTPPHPAPLCSASLKNHTLGRSVPNHLDNTYMVGAGPAPSSHLTFGQAAGLGPGVTDSGWPAPSLPSPFCMGLCPRHSTRPGQAVACFQEILVDLALAWLGKGHLSFLKSLGLGISLRWRQLCPCVCTWV